MKIFNIFMMIFFYTNTVFCSFEELRAKHQIKHAHYLTYHNNIEELSKLISENKEVINEKDFHGNTALHYAAYYNRKKIVQMMLDNQVSVDSENKLGDTPLFLATIKGHQDVMILLCEHRADIHKKNKFGNSPISFDNKRHQDILTSVNFLNTLSHK